MDRRRGAPISVVTSPGDSNLLGGV